MSGSFNNQPALTSGSGNAFDPLGLANQAEKPVFSMPAKKAEPKPVVFPTPKETKEKKEKKETKLTSLGNLPPPIAQKPVAAATGFDDAGWNDADWDFEDVEKKEVQP